MSKSSFTTHRHRSKATARYTNGRRRAAAAHRKPPSYRRDRPAPGISIRTLTHTLARLLLLAVMSVGTAQAQSDWQVDVLIPDVISIRTARPQVTFGITLEEYPPESFPAIYPAVDPPGGILRAEVFANTAGSWSVLLEIPDLLDELGRALLPADRVMFRVNGGPWVRGSPVAQVIYTSSGPTNGWQPLDIQFQLQLDGSERPGSYSVSTLLTALSDGS